MSQVKEPDEVASMPPIPPRSAGRRTIRWIERVLAVIGSLLLILVFTPVTQWLYDALDRQTPLAKAKYIVCLGGDPARVIEGCRLLSEGYGEKLILSNHDEFADQMLLLARDWGAPVDRILVDRKSWVTLDHPASIRELGVNPAADACIVVTSYAHLARSQACFARAGYRHLIMREPRWERQFRPTGGGWKHRFRILPGVLYEYAAWAEYYLRGAV
jgi:uncharacterized SAM-binding protein YcdF (DUF218 family)